MVIQHNLTAMNSNRQLGITTSSQAKSSEKLSSGYKINRAADDAAGLSISEKMRRQIRGLTQASANAQDGVSSVQTAEGALTEVHDMLQRMNELANKAANGTNSKDDRDYIQSEVKQLYTEIDRISETTKFNETYLLKGDVSGETQLNYINAHDAGLEGKLDDAGGATATFQMDPLKNGDKVTIAGVQYTIGSSSSGGTTLANFVTASSAAEFAHGDGDTITTTSEPSNVRTYLYDATSVATGEEAWETSNQTDANLATVFAGAESGDLYTVKFTNKDTGDTSDATLKVGVTQGKVTVASITVDGDANPITLGEGDTFVYQGVTYKYDASTRPSYEDADGFDQNYTPKAGDVMTDISSGVSKTVIHDGSVLTDHTSVQKLVSKLNDGATVSISADGGNTAAKVYVVGENESDGTKLTADEIAAMIKGGDYVKIEGKLSEKVTIAGQESSSDVVSATTEGTGGVTFYAAATKSVASEKTITLAEAYSLAAKELEAASNIGVDDDHKASVVNNGNGRFTITKGQVELVKDLSFNLHVGADADMSNKIGVNIKEMSAAGLGIKGLNVSDDTGIAATYAIDAIQDAIQTVSRQRSDLGAVQNRLEHTIKNVDNVAENTTAAESRIRDTDMAAEMVRYSNNNILAQAGQSMLAQANQSNQGVMSLLQ